MSTAAPPAPPTIIIEAGRTERQYWRDLWRYRELLGFLAWRDVAVRYKQTAIGVAWALIRPLATMAVLVVVFGTVARLPAGGVPYPLLVLSGMLAWQLFSAGLSEASESLVANSNLISKVYFPRLLVPLSSVAVSLVDFLITLPVLFVLMAWYGTAPTWRLAFFPAFVLLAVLAALAVGVWLAALNVKYRDFRYVIPFVLQFGLYVSPVGFSLSAVPDDYRPWFTLNPVVGLVEGCRWALLGQADPAMPFAVGVTATEVAAVLLLGVRYFRRTERTFADVI